jgi:gliding motility-associated protein GldL
MTNYSKYNLVYRLQKWMDTVEGQTFLNYAYSWGASVVILGALFKLTHLPGANIMLFLGMGTEVAVFFISAFDRPFDKTADGREIPTRITEEYLATGAVTYSDEYSGKTETPNVAGQPASSSQSARSGLSGQSAKPEDAAVAATAMPQPNFVPQMSAEDAEALNEAQSNYVDELKKLVETLEKVNEQSARLTRDSEEMENLNRTLTGISKVYEMQLKGASQQIGTIDQINDQSRMMAKQIERLNQIYARMIEAMTVNMPMAAPGTTTPQASQGNS